MKYPRSLLHFSWCGEYVPPDSTGNSVRDPLVNVSSTISCNVSIADWTSVQLSESVFEVLVPAVP